MAFEFWKRWTDPEAGLEEFFGDGSDGALGNSANVRTVVVASEYTTEGVGGRKVARLSNGWIVSAVTGGGSGNIPTVYVSKDGGGTWARLFYATNANYTLVAMAVYQTRVTIFFRTTSTMLAITKEATTVSDADYIGDAVTVDSSQTIDSAMCPTITADGSGYLYAAWSTKNATYSTSYNIRYSKSTDGGATWATVSQLTTVNNTNYNMLNPCIVLSGGNPLIVFERPEPTTKYIGVLKYNGSTWSGQGTYYVGYVDNYAQTSPCAVVDGNGYIHVAWCGKDATDTTMNNIRYSISTDGGVTWSAVTKVTTGNTYDHMNPTIAIDTSNDVHAAWFGFDSTYTTTMNIRYAKRTSGTWGSVTRLTNNSAGSGKYARVPAMLANYTNFEKPLVIYQDMDLDKVFFYGKWTDGSTYDRTDLLGGSETITSTLNGSAVIKQYTGINIPAGATITVSQPCQGLVLYCQGDVTIAGTIDMSQKAGTFPAANIIPMLVTKVNSSSVKTLEKYFQLTTVLQKIIGGAGGAGGYGGGWTGYGYRSSGGSGGAGRQNLGGFGGGGGGGHGIWGSGYYSGGNGGSVSYAEGGGGTNYAYRYNSSGSEALGKVDSSNGAGGIGSMVGQNAYMTTSQAGQCLGGGGGGSGSARDTSSAGSGSNGQYAGGFILIIAKGNITVNSGGYIKANGGTGGNGGAATPASSGYAGGGGGGGSGGGVVALFYTGSYTNSGTVQATGGTGGTGGANQQAGFETGGTGTSGSAGTIHTQQL